jgi:hypothetical protein
MEVCNILSNHIVSQEDEHWFTHSSSIQQAFRCKTNSNFGSQKTEVKYNYSLRNSTIHRNTSDFPYIRTVNSNFRVQLKYFWVAPQLKKSQGK